MMPESVSLVVNLFTKKAFLRTPFHIFKFHHHQRNVSSRFLAGKAFAEVYYPLVRTASELQVDIALFKDKRPVYENVDIFQTLASEGVFEKVFANIACVAPNVRLGALLQLFEEVEQRLGIEHRVAAAEGDAAEEGVVVDLLEDSVLKIIVQNSPLLISPSVGILAALAMVDTPRKIYRVAKPFAVDDSFGVYIYDS